MPELTIAKPELSLAVGARQHCAPVRHQARFSEMSDRPRLAVLINPTAAHGRDAWKVREILASRYRVVIHAPSSVEELKRVAREEIAFGGAAIVAAGGDGTINCVVNALGVSDIPLAILPLGTANDLARQLGIPLDPAAAAERILSRRIRRMDLIEVNGHRFCTVGGMGIVAGAALAVDRLRTRHSAVRAAMRPFGASIYSLFGVWQIVFARRIEWRIQIVGHDATGDAVTRTDQRVHGLFVANQRGVGAKLQLPVDADNADARFEICLLNIGSRVRLLRVLWALSRGLVPPPEAITTLRVSDALVTCDRPSSFLGDGDDMGSGLRFDLRVLRAALSVIC